MSALKVEWGQGEQLMNIIIYLGIMINYYTTKHSDIKT